MSTGGLSTINRALNSIPKPEEAQQVEQLRDTFVDSGVAAALESIDHQVLYGRRGTGKTHAFKYLQSGVDQGGDISFYADLRTIGSPEGLFAEDMVEPTERAARLLVDLMGQLHDAVLSKALSDEGLSDDTAFVRKLDAFASAISTVRVAGSVEVSQEDEARASRASGGRAGDSLGPDPRLEVDAAVREPAYKRR